jgi:hypothetical protein
MWLCFPALFLGAITRGIMMAGWRDGFYFGPDSEGYWRAIYSFWHGGGLDIASKRSWGYPLLVLFSPLGFVSPGFSAALWQHAIGLAAILPLGAIVRRLIPSGSWCWWIIPVTVLYALDPLLTFWEHIMIADSTMVTLAVFIAWAAMVYWQKPSWRPLLLLLLLIFLSMSVRPVGRALWAGAIPVLLFAPGTPRKTRWFHLGAAMIFILPAVSLTKVKQGDDLLFGSVFPLIPITGGPHAALKEELAPRIQAGRADLWNYVRKGQKELFEITLSNDPDHLAGPLLSALMKNPKTFDAVRHDLALEAIRNEPFGCVQITILKLGSVLANDLKQLRINPDRYRSVHEKFLVQSMGRIEPDFPAWYLRDARATSKEGIEQVLEETVKPGPIGRAYAKLFTFLEFRYNLYQLRSNSDKLIPLSLWPALLLLIGLAGWFALRLGTQLLPLLFLNGAYLALTYGVGRAVQRYRLPSEYFLILAIVLGVFVVTKLAEPWIPRWRTQLNMLLHKGGIS